MTTDWIDTVDGPREQLVIPGAEHSARQAAKARGDKLKPKRPQREPEPLFAAPEPKQLELF